jgi:3-isopropylmalate/(R)-2-methylmalate dehydratase small subunit
MQAFTSIHSLAAPLPLKDVDTDMIIPAQFLTSISRDGFGQHLFARLRQAVPTLYSNQEMYAGAGILIADSNFGCGSSREHAVWALLGAGIKVVIAPSFADIFASNSAKNGLLLVTLDAQVTTALCNESSNAQLYLTVDLASQRVCATDGREWSFEYDPFRKHCLLHGLDDMDYLLSHTEAIRGKKEELRGRFYFNVGSPNR